MKVLHLNSYYIDNHLYSQLYTVLEKDIEQRVYIPIKYDREPENIIDFVQTKLFFEKIIKRNHKYFYFKKINAITSDLIKKKLYEDINYVHAHNLFTDGAIAYKLKKKYGLKYTVAIRTTDIGLQYKYMYHRRIFIHKVLLEAEQIVFISPTYRNKLFDMMTNNFIDKISHKVKIIPNGVKDIWFNNSVKPIGKKIEKEIKLLFVGQIMKRKNILSLIEAVKELNNQNTNHKKYILNIIGGKNVYSDDYFNLFKKTISNLDWVNYKGVIKDKELLLQEYRNNDIFVMPSINELFGLVYIEALCQGKPVLYSKGEGINGFLEGKHAGESVNPNDINSISKGIEKIANTYESYKNFDEIIKPFNWNRIIDLYKEIYNNHE